MMRSHIASFLIALFVRMLAILICCVLTLTLVNFGQGRLLSAPSSFDIAFDRLAYAFGAAILSGLIAGIALIWWQAGRFTLTERIMLSFAAVVFILFSIAAISGLLLWRGFCGD